VERAEGALVLGALGGMKAGWGQSLERLGDLVGGGGTTDIEVGDRRITLARAFDAPRERVWEALTRPELFARWFVTGCGQDLEMDVRPGGRWSLTVIGADGAQHRFWGVFDEIEPPSRLAMTQGFDEHEDVPVVYTLSEEWGRTVLTRVMTFPSDAYRDGMLQSGYARSAQKGYDLLAGLMR
ncbi:MAG: SRPBCC domain-containing protein, partial [Caulobacteraceae bacterium]